MSRSNKLYELQTIDSKLDQDRNRLVEIATILADNAEVASAQNRLKDANDLFEVASKSLRSAEAKVKEQRLKIKQTDAKLYGGRIQNPKELQDLQNESQALNRYLSVLEDRQLERMLDFDEKKELVASAQEFLQLTTDKSQILHQDLIFERSEIAKEIQDLENKRISKKEDIAEDDLSIYENLRKQRFGVAVSKVNDRACSACGATLTAAQAQSARSPSQITFCETCRRILCAT
jgi:predicted  nucleic acid-binding Zn-ribbon protein